MLYCVAKINDDNDDDGDTQLHHSPKHPLTLRPGCLLRLWRYINHLITYLADDSIVVYGTVKIILNKNV